MYRSTDTIRPTDTPSEPTRCGCGAPALTYDSNGTPLCADCARAQLFPSSRLLLAVPFFVLLATLASCMTGPRSALTKCACGAIIWPGTTQCAACRKGK